jgi:trans-aconitate methyltransferase
MTQNTYQTWNPDQYAKKARFVTDLGSPVIELMAPQKTERILDLGCGDGPLTKKLADFGCSIVGVDSSPEMIMAAQSLGLDARVMPGQTLAFSEEFDAVFSNAALHWMKPPEQVIAGVWRALKHGGRFVGEFGGYGNVKTIVSAMESALERRGVDPRRFNPWYFPSIGEYASLLESQGFVVNTASLIPRPTPLPTDIGGWLETFGQSFIAAVAASERAAYLEEVGAMCRPALCNANGAWTADYVRLRFAATKPIAKVC